MVKRIPLRLTREPIVEAIFELRFGPSSEELQKTLPGLIFGGLLGEATGIEATPLAGIPKEVRQKDDQLKNMVLVRIKWKDHYHIGIGERNVTLSASPPYPGWQVFREDILRLVNLIMSSGRISSVDRYAIRYINFLEKIGDISPEDMLDVKVSVGSVDAGTKGLNVRVEYENNGHLTAVTLVAGATVNVVFPVAAQKQGAVIDIDTTCDAPTTDIARFLSDLPTKFDTLRNVNRVHFFDALTDQAIALLGPQYEQIH